MALALNETALRAKALCCAPRRVGLRHLPDSNPSIVGKLAPLLPVDSEEATVEAESIDA
jgi:hypothetical protein